MKLLSVASLFSACLMLTGCAGMAPQSQIVSAEPTKESVGAQKIYQNTIYTKDDFLESGALKKFYDYDFAKEDAPCTVLGETYSQSASTYEVEIGGEAFVFVCKTTGYLRSDFHFHRGARSLTDKIGTRLYLQKEPGSASRYKMAIERSVGDRPKFMAAQI
ncbi:hypothetical protein EFK68_03855 [Pseudomonas aeruginosa]|uniref:hypothetical protein n=1 Tax=Pseudomonas aeruginosa TaxID=287 RepID=UPI00093C70E3|nr:hypothetical protein [Pseudomonas aeruginosa]EKF7416910.1 hypothetical protein [Pseudomonas aeruginosa]EKX3434267.1 hypothetical protein [Pseudomonas aeruginosa]RNF58513.1 hypothetical protein EFK68_03855 [Pseudomonas aeruginosa]HCA5866539.1 hypothetical protein [Pseudomonas aeruginosa]HCA7376656.1 hypothetical protein [Pseudomonas aeruginosa]